MKRLLPLFLLSTCAAFAEQGTLSSNTVMRTANSLVILKAGTVVQILAHNDKTVTVKAGDKTGLIPWSALEADGDMMDASRATVSAPAPAPAPAPVVATASAPAPAATPATPHKAQTMYGKAVEKAADAASSHEKALVSPTDEILGGK